MKEFDGLYSFISGHKVEMSNLPYAMPLGKANGSGFRLTWNNNDEHGRTRPDQGVQALMDGLLDSGSAACQLGMTVRQVHQLVLR